MGRILIQDGREITYGGDSTIGSMSMPTIKVNKKPITITNTGVMIQTPSEEEKAKRRTTGEVWDEITKTWKKVDESGIIDRAIDLFNPKGKTQVTLDKNKIIVDDKKDNTLYYILGSALIVIAGYIVYKKLR